MGIHAPDNFGRDQGRKTDEKSRRRVAINAESPNSMAMIHKIAKVVN